MGKTLPLTQANLKGFVRNWRSIILLIVFPLMLITIVFLSFNPLGLQKIPIGVIESGSDFDIDEYADTYFSYLEINKFSELNDCMSELENYNQYLCMVISNSGRVDISIFYDNTREPVIWEIIERVKGTIELLQKERSKQIAGDIFNSFEGISDKMESLSGDLTVLKSDVNNYITETDRAIVSLGDTKGELVETLDMMDSDISSVKSEKNALKSEKDSYYRDSISAIRIVRESLYSMDGLSDENIIARSILFQQIDELESDVNSYNMEAENRFSQIDYRISVYESKSVEGRRYVSEIDQGVMKLKSVKQDLISLSGEIGEGENELKEIHDQFEVFSTLSPESLVNPITIKNNPVYIPAESDEFLNENKTQGWVEGLNLISLQTIFPTILILIIMFLSLLVSSSICLDSINSTVRDRIMLIRGISLPELLSMYFSSYAILIVPIIFILFAGDYLFRIHILANLPVVLFIVFLLISNFLLWGIMLSFLIKNKSNTLLVVTFLLVLLVFLSGFLLPIERMSSLSSIFAAKLPSKLALSGFNKVVFYGKSFAGISWESLGLAGWIAGDLLILALVRFVRR